MIINFFEYKKNCQEFKILVKATSENATRKDLKQGQILFKSIYQKIVAIEIKLGEIEQSITNRNLESVGSKEKKLLDLQKFKIEYEPNLEKNLEIESYHDMNHYYGFIQPKIEQILEFLDSNFDYEMYKKQTLDLEKRIKDGKADCIAEAVYEIKNHPIEQSIETVLEFYSNKSFQFMEYITLFLKHKNQFQY